MGLLGAVLDPIIPETTTTLEVENADLVTEVHLSSGGVTEQQEIVSQDESTLAVNVELGSLPYGDAMLDIVTDTETTQDPVTVEPHENETVVDITDPVADNTVCDPMTVDLEQGDQVVYVDEFGAVLPDGSLTTGRPVYVKIWDASAGAWTEPTLVTKNDTGSVVSASKTIPAGSMQRDPIDSLERASQ